jgi:phosphatidylinositol-3-phosphatase
MRPRWPGAAAAIALTTALLASPGTGANAAITPAPCGGSGLQPVRHVIVLMDENKSYDAIIGPPGSSARAAAPYINDLADACGLATDFHAITHPSHSDYIATVAGDTYVPAGCTSWKCVSVPLDHPSIFGQIGSASGLSWRSYAESMTKNCQTSSAGTYSPGHNPPVWFTPIANDCAKWAVPISQLTTDLANDALPSYSWVVPNKCNDMHNCSGQSPITAGDNFIRTWMTSIMATPSYQDGSTVVFITWDEGVEGGRPFGEDCLATKNLTDESCHIPTIVASRHVQPGTKSGSFFTLYGLLKTSEGLLGLPYLGHAGDASTADMISAFDLGSGGGGGGDGQAPSEPSGLHTTSVTASGVGLSWTASVDNVGVDHYVVSRDGGTVAGNVHGTSFTDTGVTGSATYGYQVRAVDAAGNASAFAPMPPLSVTTPAGSGNVVFSDGFESGDLSAWSSVAGLAVQQAISHAGSWAARATSAASGGRTATRSLAGHADLTTDLWFHVLSQGGNAIDLLKLRNPGGSAIYRLTLNGSDHLVSRNSPASLTRTSSTVVGKGTWHHLQARLVINGSSGSATVWLDGTQIADLSGPGNFGMALIRSLKLGDGHAGRTFDVAFDDVTLHP